LCGTGTLAGARFVKEDAFAQAGVPVPHNPSDDRIANPSE